MNCQSRGLPDPSPGHVQFLCFFLPGRGGNYSGLLKCLSFWLPCLFSITLISNLTFAISFLSDWFRFNLFFFRLLKVGVLILCHRVKLSLASVSLSVWVCLPGHVQGWVPRPPLVHQMPEYNKQWNPVPGGRGAPGFPAPPAAPGSPADRCSRGNFRVQGSDPSGRGDGTKCWQASAHPGRRCLSVLLLWAAWTVTHACADF